MDANCKRVTWLSLFLLLQAGLIGYSQPNPYFNYGRTRSAGGAPVSTTNKKELYHVDLYKRDSLASVLPKIVLSRWEDGTWNAPAFLKLTDYAEVHPILSPDGNKLYFTSNAPVPGITPASSDFNIWVSEKKNNEWQAPVFLNSLNSPQRDMITHIDQNGDVYMMSDRNGSADIYVTQFDGQQWAKPITVDAWNTVDQDEYASVYDNLGVAFLQKTITGKSTEILISMKVNGSWQKPIPMVYPGKSTYSPYIQRWPKLSSDGGTLYLGYLNLILEYDFRKIASQNNLKIKTTKHSSLSIIPPADSDLQVFGGWKLKSNNGISFTKGFDTLYSSLYTTQKDSTGNSFIKVHYSIRKKNEWSTPQPVSFNNPNVPFEYHPVVSPDGKMILYNSRAPIPGSNKKYMPKNNIWYVAINNGVWGTPQLLDVAATEFYDDYASIAANKNLYFQSDRPGGLGGGDIYRCRWENNAWSATELISELSSAANENDLCIDPQERFIIFNRYHEATREIDLHIAFNKNGQWTKPRKLEIIDRNTDWELTPSLSPDLQYFFFEVNSNICRIGLNELLLPEEREFLSLTKK